MGSVVGNSGVADVLTAGTLNDDGADVTVVGT
jgi:hypothetical protein